LKKISRPENGLCSLPNKSERVSGWKLAERFLAMPMEYYETLTEIVIDNYAFKATWSASSADCCILWIQDTDFMEEYEPLGRFSRFDKRKILEFVIRYVTNSQLREDISKRRFQRHMEGLSPTDFHRISELSHQEREVAFRELFNLDSALDEAVDINWKRRVMARKFHPDRGGDNVSMALINEGYELLTDERKGNDERGRN